MPNPGLLYLDGNSLGRPALATLDRIAAVLRDDWGRGLIGSWNEGWYDLPTGVGDLVGRELLGAGPGQVVVADSTTVNVFTTPGTDSFGSGGSITPATVPDQ